MTDEIPSSGAKVNMKLEGAIIPRNWADCYAEYMAREQAGQELPR